MRTSANHIVTSCRLYCIVLVDDQHHITSCNGAVRQLVNHIPLNGTMASVSLTTASKARIDSHGRDWSELRGILADVLLISLSAQCVEVEFAPLTDSDSDIGHFTPQDFSKAWPVAATCLKS